MTDGYTRSRAPSWRCLPTAARTGAFESFAAAPSGAHLFVVLASPLGDKKTPGHQRMALVHGLKL